MRPEGYRYGFLFLTRPRDMELLRQRMLEQPEKFLHAVAHGEKSAGILLDGDRYARPKPCPDARLERFFGLKNLFAIKDCPPDDLLYSPALADEVRKTMLAWKPLLDFCRL